MSLSETFLLNTVELELRRSAWFWIRLVIGLVVAAYAILCLIAGVYLNLALCVAFFGAIWWLERRDRRWRKDLSSNLAQAGTPELVSVLDGPLPDGIKMPLRRNEANLVKLMVSEGTSIERAVKTMALERYQRTAGIAIHAYTAFDHAVLGALTAAAISAGQPRMKLPSKLATRLAKLRELVPATVWTAEHRAELLRVLAEGESAAETRHRVFHWTPEHIEDAEDPVVHLMKLDGRVPEEVDRHEQQTTLGTIEREVERLQASAAALADLVKALKHQVASNGADAFE